MVISWNTGPAAERFRLKNKKKIKKKTKSSSAQAGGPAHKESGSKLTSLTGPKRWDIIGL